MSGIRGPLKNILAYTDNQVVFCEFNSDTYSFIFDAWASIAFNDHVVNLIYCMTTNWAIEPHCGLHGLHDL